MSNEPVALRARFSGVPGAGVADCFEDFSVGEDFCCGLFDYVVASVCFYVSYHLRSRI